MSPLRGFKAEECLFARVALGSTLGYGHLWPLAIFKTGFRPKGAAANSPGRKPWAKGHDGEQSPERATEHIERMRFPSPLQGSSTSLQK